MVSPAVNNIVSIAGAGAEIGVNIGGLKELKPFAKSINFVGYAIDASAVYNNTVDYYNGNESGYIYGYDLFNVFAPYAADYATRYFLTGAIYGSKCGPYGTAVGAAAGVYVGTTLTVFDKFAKWFRDCCTQLNNISTDIFKEAYGYWEKDI